MTEPKNNFQDSPVKDNILGCFVSYPPTIYGASEQEIASAKSQGDLFRSYVWGEKGISIPLKTLKHVNYGHDLETILFQFYVKPIPYLQQNLKEIEGYRRKEKSIGIPIIVTDENFFNNSDDKRYAFLKKVILQKLSVLAEVIKNKKLDTKIDLLKVDVASCLK